MQHLSSVVWSEGMYLGPHHFQAQNRYFEDSVHFAISSLWSNAFGFSGYRMDVEALENGKVSLLRAGGIFPDGLPFQIPECDPLPAERNIVEVFDPARESIDVFLGIPKTEPGRPNYTDTGNGAARDVRYSIEGRLLPDENTGRDEKQIPLGRKNLRLVFDTEVTKDLLTLPLARVTRNISGRLTYNSMFVPPCLTFNASERLSVLLQNLVAALDEKSSSLSKMRRGNKQSLIEYSAREISQFWLLHAINAGLAPLRHFGASKHGHPEELYVEMARLAGALCTFIIDSHPQRLPLYNHLDSTACFEELEDHIYRHINIVFPSNWVSIPLKQVKSSYYAGEIPDDRCYLETSRWIFGIRSRAGEAETIVRTPSVVKICSSQFIEKLVNKALPGMPLKHLSSPPSVIPAKLESQYFGITKSGPCWEHLVQVKTVGIHIPEELPNPEIELFIAFENQGNPG